MLYQDGAYRADSLTARSGCAAAAQLAESLAAAAPPYMPLPALTPRRHDNHWATAIAAAISPVWVSETLTSEIPRSAAL